MKSVLAESMKQGKRWYLVNKKYKSKVQVQDELKSVFVDLLWIDLGDQFGPRLRLNILKSRPIFPELVRHNCFESKTKRSKGISQL